MSVMVYYYDCYSVLCDTYGAIAAELSNRFSVDAHFMILDLGDGNNFFLSR